MDYSGLSCAELYRMTSNIEPATQRQLSPFINEKSDQFAAAIGTVITAGYYHYGYTAANGYLQEYQISRNLKQMDYLRQLMAEQRCFEKF